MPICKIHLKSSSANGWPFCLGLNVLTGYKIQDRLVSQTNDTPIFDKSQNIIVIKIANQIYIVLFSVNTLASPSPVHDHKAVGKSD